MSMALYGSIQSHIDELVTIQNAEETRQGLSTVPPGNTLASLQYQQGRGNYGFGQTTYKPADVDSHGDPMYWTGSTPYPGVNITGIGKDAFETLIDLESKGDINALLGFSNQADGKFKGIKVSEMTISEAIKFAEKGGDYAEFSKEFMGSDVRATPMGKYQIVGSTLQDLVDRYGDSLGIDPDTTLFSEEIQDKLFAVMAHEITNSAREEVYANRHKYSSKADSDKAFKDLVIEKTKAKWAAVDKGYDNNDFYGDDIYDMMVQASGPNFISNAAQKAAASGTFTPKDDLERAAVKAQELGVPDPTNWSSNGIMNEDDFRGNFFRALDTEYFELEPSMPSTVMLSLIHI